MRVSERERALIRSHWGMAPESMCQHRSWRWNLSVRTAFCVAVRLSKIGVVHTLEQRRRRFLASGCSPGIREAAVRRHKVVSNSIASIRTGTRAPIRPDGMLSSRASKSIISRLMNDGLRLEVGEALLHLVLHLRDLEVVAGWATVDPLPLQLADLDEVLAGVLASGSWSPAQPRVEVQVQDRG